MSDVSCGDRKPLNQTPLVCEKCGSKYFEIALEDVINEYGNYYYERIRLQCSKCKAPQVVWVFDRLLDQSRSPALAINGGSFKIGDPQIAQGKK